MSDTCNRRGSDRTVWRRPDVLWPLGFRKTSTGRARFYAVHPSCKCMEQLTHRNLPSFSCKLPFFAFSDLSCGNHLSFMFSFESSSIDNCRDSSSAILSNAFLNLLVISSILSSTFWPSVRSLPFELATLLDRSALSKSQTSYTQRKSKCINDSRSITHKTFN